MSEKESEIMGRNLIGKEYMHRITLWVDRQQWEKFAQVVPRHMRSARIREFIKQQNDTKAKGEKK